MLQSDEISLIKVLKSQNEIKIKKEFEKYTTHIQN